MAKLNLASEFDMGSTKDTDNHKFQFLEETPFKEALQGRLTKSYLKHQVVPNWYHAEVKPGGQ